MADAVRPDIGSTGAFGVLLAWRDCPPLWCVVGGGINDQSRRRTPTLMRHKVSHFLALVVISALTVGLLAGPADAKTHRMSAKQKAHVRAKLRKQIKKNPKVVQKKWFLKRASLVNFQLPVTIRLRGVPPTAPNTNPSAVSNGNYCYDNQATGPLNTSCTAYNGSNPNIANIDLGSSL